jgi:hypothetical protein
MTKQYAKGIGGVDAEGLPTSGPTDIQDARSPRATLESATDVTGDMGPTAPRVQRGTHPPATGPGRDSTSKGR